MRAAGPQPRKTRPPAPAPRVGRGVALLGLGTLAALSACMPTGPEARRSAYLDCARDQGLTVIDGTIRTTSAADLDRLNACQALPR